MIKNFQTVKIDSITNMMALISGAGYRNFQPNRQWESALCALLLSLEPQCRTYRLMEALPYGKDTFGQMDVLNCISNLGYYARSSKADLSNIDSRLLPCLFVQHDGTPIVLLEDQGDAVTLFRHGIIQEITRSSMHGEIGTLWVFELFDESRSPTSAFMRGGTGYSWFRSLLSRFRTNFIQIMAAGLALNIVALATPLYIMVVYDRVIGAGILSSLPMLTAGVLLAILFEWLLRGVRSRSLSWLAARMDNVVSNQIFAHLISLPPDLIERASVSAQIARLKTFEAVRDFFSGSVFLSMMELPFVILAAIVMYAVAGPLVFVPLAMAGCFGLLYYLVQRRVKVVIRLAAKATSARQQFTLETLEKINGVRGYGLTRKWQERFRDLSGREMFAHFHLNWVGMMAENIAHSLTLVSAVATVGFGVHLIWSGEISTGALVAAMILTWRVLTPFYSLCTMIPRLEQIRNSIIQVNKLMDINTEAAEEKTRARLSRMRGSVSFSNVELRYQEDNDRIFSNLTFDAQAGDIIAITGENGAGKTSLLKLIKGLYKPHAGSVRIDGFDIRQLDIADLRRQIAYVPQQPDFFLGSIAENMRIGNPLASREDIEKALILANVWDDICAMEKGVDTLISRHGNGSLSSGFLFRLSMARAYLHVAPILLIDEVPNVLFGDRAGKGIKEYLADVKGKRTVFIISYREDVMRMADLVITLRRGEMPHIVDNRNIGHIVTKDTQEAA